MKTDKNTVENTLEKKLKAAWNILNKVDSLFHVTDIETDEILYMNDRMAGTFNTTKDKVIGKKCWEVLNAGQSGRCPFCPVPELLKNPGKTVTWEEFNLVTNRYYRNMDSLIEWSDGKLVHLQYSIDITETKLRARQKELMTDISQSFIIEGSSIEEKIKKALPMAGEFLKIGAIGFYKYDPQLKTLGIIDIWTDGTLHEPRRVAPFNETHFLYKSFMEDKKFFVMEGNVQEKKDIYPISQSLKKVNSIMLMPIIINNGFWGILFFAAKEKDKQWSDVKKNLGKFLISVLTNAVMRHEAEKELKDYVNSLECNVREKLKEALRFKNAILNTVINMVELRDKLTGGHVLRTQLYVKAMLGEIIRRGRYKEEIFGWDMDFFITSISLHDIGKITIPDAILNKPGRLTPEEFDIMKTHVSAGVDAIEDMIKEFGTHLFLRHVLLIVGTHHERWNGSGYPAGLKGEKIPLEGRLMAIADVYDALISRRQYKEPFSHEAACEMIKEGAGTQFDPVLVEVFVKVEKEFDRIAREIGS